MGTLTTFLLMVLFNSLAPGVHTSSKEDLLVGAAASARGDIVSAAQEAVAAVFHKEQKTSTPQQASTTPPLPTKLPGSSTPTPQPLTTPASTVSTMAASTSKTPETTPAQSTLPPASTSTLVLSSTLPPPTMPCVTGSPNIFYPATPYGIGMTSNFGGNGDTVGQTFTPTNDSIISSFSFDMRSPGGNSPALIFAAYLYAWDFNRRGPIEPQLFASAPTFVPTDGAVVTFNVPGCLTLNASTQYVAFLSSSGYWLADTQLVDVVLTSFAMGPPLYTTTAGNDTAAFTTTARWDSQGHSPLAFNATYACSCS